MKIGLTIPTLEVAGGVKCLVKVAAGLRERGHEVFLYWQAYSFKNYLKHKIFTPKITWTEEIHRLIPLRSWKEIPPLDVLFASSWRTADPVSRWSQETGGQGIYYIQHHEAIWDGGAEVAKTYDLPLKKIVISTWLKNILEEEYHQQSVLCVTPVDQDLFEVQDHRPDRSRRILMLHHTFAWKGVEDGLEAFERVKKEFPDLTLVVLGGRQQNPPLPQGVEYHYRPSRQQLMELYASCGVFLCPSWHEGLGMPSMEAMATGALLVTTDTGGSRDFAEHGVTALVSPARHVEALAANLKLALVQWEGLQNLREAGQKKIREFCWKDNLDSIESLISS